MQSCRRTHPPPPPPSPHAAQGFVVRVGCGNRGVEGSWGGGHTAVPPPSKQALVLPSVLLFPCCPCCPLFHLWPLKAKDNDRTWGLFPPSLRAGCRAAETTVSRRANSINPCLCCVRRGPGAYCAACCRVDTAIHHRDARTQWCGVHTKKLVRGGEQHKGRPGEWRLHR